MRAKLDHFEEMAAWARAETVQLVAWLDLTVVPEEAGKPDLAMLAAVWVVPEALAVLMDFRLAWLGNFRHCC